MAIIYTSAKGIEQAHRNAVSKPLCEVATLLQELLSVRLTAYLAGVKSGKSVARWASGEVEGIRQESEQRLRTAYEITQLLLQFESPKVVRAWFIGMNPELDDISPAEIIREGRFREAIGAAKAFIVSG